MIRSLRWSVLALAAMGAASTASAATYNYEFKTFYDTSTILNPFDKVTLDYSVANLIIADVAGGVQLTLTYNNTAFPGKNGSPTLDELWLKGPKGTLSRSSGAALDGDTGYYKYGFLTENGPYNWDIEFKGGAFVEGSKSVLTILGSGVNAGSFASVAPMLELTGVGRPYSGLLGLNANVHFVGNQVAVPEPGTYALMGLGLAGIAFVSRSKKRQG